MIPITRRCTLAGNSTRVLFLARCWMELDCKSEREISIHHFIFLYTRHFLRRSARVSNHQVSLAFPRRNRSLRRGASFAADDKVIVPKIPIARFRAVVINFSRARYRDATHQSLQKITASKDISQRDLYFPSTLSAQFGPRESGVGNGAVHCVILTFEVLWKRQL